MQLIFRVEIAKSKLLPSFFIFAGAKLINIFLLGNSIPEFFIAVFILFLDSFTVVSGNPTISNSGIPLLISVWISIKFPSNPFSAINSESYTTKDLIKISQNVEREKVYQLKSVK